jgi:hypothetical protein
MTLNATLSTTEKLLFAACSAAPLYDLQQLYQAAGDRALWEACEEHELSGHFAHKLADAGLPVPEHWQNAHHQTETRISAYLTELDHVADILARRGIPLVALKNAGIARGLYRCAGCSPMGDVDVLVRRADFADAHRLLVTDGYTCASRNPFEAATVDEGTVSGGTEYHRELEGIGTFWLELQWRPVAGRWIRPDQEPDGDILMSRSLPIEGTEVRLLAPEDNLLQVCLHTAKHSYVRAPGLRLHCDVDRIVRNASIDWALFLRTVERLRVKTAVYFSLAIPQSFMRTPIPPQVMDGLRPPRRKGDALWKALLRAGLFHPNASKFSNAQYVRFTAMLYDSVEDIRRAIFPDSSWMKNRYEFSSPALLPLYHTRRWYDLAFRRTGI